MNISELVKRSPFVIKPDQFELISTYRPLSPIIGTMRRWLDDEPVWPLDKILDRWGQEFMMYRILWDEGIFLNPPFGRSLEMYYLRMEAIKEFGFSIPCRELLDALKQHEPIVEIGAGSGYITALMRKNGIEVVGTDPVFEIFPFVTGFYDSRQQHLQGKTAVRRYRDYTVFCSWPSLRHTWFRQALRAMRIGQKLIVIEEDACAEDTAWEYRDAAFHHIANIPLPAWYYMNDRASIWIKRH